MSYLRSIKHVGIALLALGGLACGQKAQQTKPDNKETPASASAPATQAEAGAETPQPVEAVGRIEALEQVPSSSIIAVAFGRPEASLKLGQNLISRSGLPSLEKDLQEGLAEFRKVMGFDFFDVEAGQKATGIDLSKGVAFGLDGQLLGKGIWHSEYSASVQIRKEPTPYFVFALKDPALFDTWIRGVLQKAEPDARFEEDKVGDLKAVYVYKKMSTYIPPPPPGGPVPASAPAKEKLWAAMVAKDNYMYFFMLDVEPSPVAEVPDPVGPFKVELKSFFDRLSSPITSTASFQNTIKKVNPGGDIFFYMDNELLAKLSEMTENAEYIFLPPKTPDQQRAQDEEKRYMADYAKWNARDIEMFKTFASVTPALAMSIIAEEKQAVCKGYALIGPSRQPAFEKMFRPAAEAPDFAAILPESTTFLYRQSINPIGVKDFIYEILSAEGRAEFDQEIQKSNRDLAPLGLELERDFLGAFTGHGALGSPSLSALVLPWLLLRPGEAAAFKLPPLVGVAQLTSPDAGDKLLGLISLAAMGEKMMVKSEEINGDTLYSMDVPPFSFAWGRTGNLLVGGYDVAAVKEVFQRAQKPGASFAEKMTAPMAKELASSKSATGGTADLGELFTSLAAFPQMTPSDKGVFEQLGKFFGQTTMQISYEEGGLSWQGEMLFR